MTTWTWMVNTEGKTYMIIVRVRSYFDIMAGDGQLLVNGKVVKAWGSSIWGPPEVISFEVEGRSALLRLSGILHKNYDLFFDGELIKRRARSARRLHGIEYSQGGRKMILDDVRV